MARVQPKKLSAEDKEVLLKELWKLIASLNNEDEVENFFLDLLSETEAVMLARRLRIAKRLLEGLNYGEIQEELRSSTGTIASVHRWLQANEERYSESLPQLEKKLTQKTRSRSRRGNGAQPFTFKWIRKKYPLHFLLFNLLDDPYRTDK